MTIDDIEGIWARITPELYIGVKPMNRQKITDELIQFEIKKIEGVYFTPDSTLCNKFLLESPNDQSLRVIENIPCDYYYNETEMILFNPFYGIEKIDLHKNTILQIIGYETKFYMKLPPENTELINSITTNILSDLS